MSENVGASTSRNPKGLHGLYGDNFISFTFIYVYIYRHIPDIVPGGGRNKLRLGFRLGDQSAPGIIRASTTVLFTITLSLLM
jgi:hypothetical protein